MLSIFTLLFVSNVYYQAPKPTLNQLLATSSPTARLEVMSVTVSKYANQYNVSSKDMMAVLKCENRDFDPYLQSYWKDDTSPNGREESYGVAQINTKQNPNITYEQATDADFSIDFMARMFSQGKQHLWSCSRMVLARK